MDECGTDLHRQILAIFAACRYKIISNSKKNLKIVTEKDTQQVY